MVMIFQLRNLLWATSKHDIYLVHDSSVLHWSPLTRTITEVLDVSEAIVPPSQVYALKLLNCNFFVLMHGFRATVLIV
jgi:hypothetical protein